jgi:hypothetical protein
MLVFPDPWTKPNRSERKTIMVIKGGEPSKKPKKKAAKKKAAKKKAAKKK